MYEDIPERIMGALERYAEQHCPTGDFLRAVLGNDLMEAVGRADDDCISALADICKYVFNEMPGTCHGSYAKVDAWLKRKEVEV